MESIVKPIFKNEAFQKQFDEEGYIKVPFIDEALVSELETHFYKNHDNLEKGGFVSDSYSSNVQWKREMSDYIKEKLQDANDRIFKDYTAFGGAFLYKLPSANSQLEAHQDWTIVDEEKYVAINCWFPLCDTNAKNGTLHVLPKSHYSKQKSLRAPTIPFYFSGNEKLIMESLIPIEVKKGEAIILNQSLVHYSTPNLSDKIRIAITSGIKSLNAPMIFHYLTNGNVQQYKMEENFLVSFENFGTDIYKEPNGKIINKFKLESKPMSKSELKRSLKGQRKEDERDTSELSLVKKFFQKIMN